MKAHRLAVCFALVLTSATAAPAQSGTTQTPQPPEQKPEQKPEEPKPIYEEQLIVSASKVEQQLVNAPATVSLVTSDVIQSTPATNYAELLRGVPGVNISQTSARDFNITMRGATSTLATSQLALLDGRSLYLDFFGFVAWDLLPVNPSELKQIEVIRGPASAIWGANAMNGVINFISKTPRELAATTANTVTMTFGGFDRNVTGGQQLGTGKQFGINGTHAQAVNDRWSYKISAGAYTSDPFARPVGNIPNNLTPPTPYPTFVNQGTSQPKFDTRVDYDAPDGKYKLSVAGGYSGTDGIIHTGIGPFDIDGLGVSYGTLRYTRGTFRANFFTNILDGNASALLAFGTDGKPIPFSFNTKTFDWEVGNVTTVGTRQVLSYGGNFRYNAFDLSIAPAGDNRAEGGGYIQDEVFVDQYVRLNLGARVDKFDNIADAVFSPRVALILKPGRDHAVRVSYNKAFRSPSLINNFLDVNIINQLNLGVINPLFAGKIYNFPLHAIGNQDLTEESTESVELSYTGVVNNRATVSAAVYFTKNTDEIFFTQTGRYRALNPPPGWVNALAPLPAATALGVLEVLPPACSGITAACTTGGLPSEFGYRNLGIVKNKGFELGIDGAVNEALNVFANYSYQATPKPNFDISEVNLPPKNRFNVGFNFSQNRYLGNLAVSYVDDAFWQDVLDARYHGPTKAYTQVNGAFGVKWADGHVLTSIKAVNLFNEEIQSHVFGDIIKRQVIGELRFTF